MPPSTAFFRIPEGSLAPISGKGFPGALLWKRTSYPQSTRNKSSVFQGDPGRPRRHNSGTIAAFLFLSQISGHFRGGHAARLGCAGGCLPGPSISQMHKQEAGTGPGTGQNDWVRNCPFHFQPGIPLTQFLPQLAQNRPLHNFLPLVEIQLAEPKKE